eukprot:ANDGO_02023.mRNA.1 Midasin
MSGIEQRVVDGLVSKYACAASLSGLRDSGTRRDFLSVLIDVMLRDDCPAMLVRDVVDDARLILVLLSERLFVYIQENSFALSDNGMLNVLFFFALSSLHGPRDVFFPKLEAAVQLLRSRTSCFLRGKGSDNAKCLLLQVFAICLRHNITSMAFRLPMDAIMAMADTHVTARIVCDGVLHQRYPDVPRILDFVPSLADLWKVRSVSFDFSTVDGGFETPMELPVIAELDYLVVDAVRPLLADLIAAVHRSDPILLVGPSGCGKSALLKYLHRVMMVRDNATTPLMTINVDDSLDSKDLLGTYVSGSEAGSFEWQPGALTNAVDQGAWLVLEDLHLAASDIHAIMFPLLEPNPSNRSLVNGARCECRMCLPSFRILATVPEASFESLKRAPGFHRWTVFHLPVLSTNDMLKVVSTVHSGLPPVLCRQLVALYENLNGVMVPITISREDFLSFDDSVPTNTLSRILRKTFTLRDVLCTAKRLMAVSSDASIHSALLSGFVSSHVAEMFILEICDSALALLPTSAARFVVLRQCEMHRQLSLSDDDLQRIVVDRKPTVLLSPASLVVGRVTLTRTASHSLISSLGVAETRHHMQLLEKIANSVQFSEHVLLLGETGGGKTSIVTQLARVVGKTLLVHNLSPQSDSSELIGGYRPVDPGSHCRKLYDRFVRLMARLPAASASKFQGILDKVTGYASTGKWVECSKQMSRLANHFISILDKAETAEETSLPQSKRSKLSSGKEKLLGFWQVFSSDVHKFLEQEQVFTAGGFAFEWIDGILAQALKNGEWLLLDEVNMAPGEVLERLAALLDGDVIVAESTSRIVRHPDFRLFACMNPGGDAGKKDLPPQLRTRFTEIYVSELTDRTDLTLLVHHYLPRLPQLHSSLVEFHLRMRSATLHGDLVDGAGHKPVFSLRSLSRALDYSRRLAPLYGDFRSLRDGIMLAYGSLLGRQSLGYAVALVQELFPAFGATGYQPPPSLEKDGVVIEGFSFETVDEKRVKNDSKFILTPSVKERLLHLARACSVGTYPVLLEGPTSAGKTSLVEYLAGRLGQRVIRINNHEHTDLAEYVGTYLPNEKTGRLEFREGLLVQALRNGYWLLLDELNLAPSEVLEALNRLLDDNRELRISETGETIKPHRGFMLFATQNPSVSITEGVSYGGRKQLSKALRNRFVGISVEDLPSVELVTIIAERFRVPDSMSRKTVDVMEELQRLRRIGGVFAGKSGYVTARDIFKWCARLWETKEEFATNGFYVLGEKLRTAEERDVVRIVIEKAFKTAVRVEYDIPSLSGVSAPIVMTRSWKRMLCLVIAALKNREPVLLVGETGIGKTTVVEVLSQLWNTSLEVLVCHSSTETSDLFGALRPSRRRVESAERAQSAIREFCLRENVPMDFSAFENAQISQVLADLKQMFGDRSDFSQLCEEVAELTISSDSLFSWVDGPLVRAFTEGKLFLADEISLADDAVLERLNSVLEGASIISVPDRSCGTEISCHPSFFFVSTMNPGGDFGKRELSPALRSRLTEIWVPSPLSDLRDRNFLVQGLCGASEFGRSSELTAFAKVVDRICDAISTNHGIGSLRRTVSVRDLAYWIRSTKSFVSSCGMEFGLAFCLAGEMVFLDSISAKSPERIEWQDYFREAVYLSQFPLWNVTPPCHFERPSGIAFGSPEFFSVPVTEKRPVTFSFAAPVTRTVTHSLLRAFSLNQPVLLEGPPGVGKTAVVEQLARVLGIQVVRVNLSDQTDLADLVGQDAPSEGHRFVWKDGPLLSAMKSGSWLLLDELNLAPQTVLEGLNSILDHRKQIFVPELGATITAAPQFRVFAAQNPVSGGGGRKGLPQSFLNRFVLVSVPEMSREDVLSILSSVYESCVSESERDHMVAVMETGGLNLRDVLRWADKMRFNMSFADALRWTSLMRVSQLQDRTAIWNAVGKPGEVGRDSDPRYTAAFFNEFLKGACDTAGHPELVMTSRFLPLLYGCVSALSPDNVNSRLLILSGTPGTGRSSLITAAHSLLQLGPTVRVVSLPVSSSTDSADLLGTYEQTNRSHRVALLKDDIGRIVVSCAKTCADVHQYMIAHSLWQSYFSWESSLEESAWAALLNEVSNFDAEFAARMRAAHASYTSSLNSVFSWVDGLLVRSCLSGDWLILEHAELCPGAVLDRLNALCEPNGVLHITEAGEDRCIVPHANFKLVMMVDSKNGHVSRAMRSRAVEVSVEDLSSLWEWSLLSCAADSVPLLSCLRAAQTHSLSLGVSVLTASKLSRTASSMKSWCWLSDSPFQLRSLGLSVDARDLDGQQVLQFFTRLPVAIQPDRAVRALAHLNPQHDHIVKLITGVSAVSQSSVECIIRAEAWRLGAVASNAQVDLNRSSDDADFLTVVRSLMVSDFNDPSSVKGKAIRNIVMAVLTDLQGNISQYTPRFREIALGVVFALLQGHDVPAKWLHKWLLRLLKTPSSTVTLSLDALVGSMSTHGSDELLKQVKSWLRPVSGSMEAVLSKLERQFEEASSKHLVDEQNFIQAFATLVSLKFLKPTVGIIDGLRVAVESSVSAETRRPLLKNEDPLQELQQYYSVAKYFYASFSSDMFKTNFVWKSIISHAYTLASRWAADQHSRFFVPLFSFSLSKICMYELFAFSEPFPLVAALKLRSRLLSVSAAEYKLGTFDLVRKYGSMDGPNFKAGLDSLLEKLGENVFGRKMQSFEACALSMLGVLSQYCRYPPELKHRVLSQAYSASKQTLCDVMNAYVASLKLNDYQLQSQSWSNQMQELDALLERSLAQAGEFSADDWNRVDGILHETTVLCQSGHMDASSLEMMRSSSLKIENLRVRVMYQFCLSMLQLHSLHLSVCSTAVPRWVDSILAYPPRKTDRICDSLPLKSKIVESLLRGNATDCLEFILAAYIRKRQAQQEELGEKGFQFVKSQRLKILEDTNPDKKDYDAEIQERNALDDQLARELFREAADSLAFADHPSADSIGPVDDDDVSEAVTLFLNSRALDPFSLLGTVLRMRAEYVDRSPLAFSSAVIPIRAISELFIAECTESDSGRTFFQPNPLESTLVMDVLSPFRARLIDLLEVHPEHPQLLVALEHIDRMVSFPVPKTALSTFAMGLEMLVDRVSDWNRLHGPNSRYHIALDDVVRLLLRWRKLETECWQSICEEAVRHKDFSFVPQIWAAIRPASAMDAASADAELSLVEGATSYVTGAQLGSFATVLKCLNVMATTASSKVVYKPIIENAVSAESSLHRDRIRQAREEVKWRDASVEGLRDAVAKNRRLLARTVRSWKEAMAKPVSPLLVGHVSPPISEPTLQVPACITSVMPKAIVLNSVPILLTHEEAVSVSGTRHLGNVSAIGAKMERLLSSSVHAIRKGFSEMSSDVVENYETLQSRLMELQRMGRNPSTRKPKETAFTDLLRALTEWKLPHLKSSVPQDMWSSWRRYFRQDLLTSDPAFSSYFVLMDRCMACFHPLWPRSGALPPTVEEKARNMVQNMLYLCYRFAQDLRKMEDIRGKLHAANRERVCDTWVPSNLRHLCSRLQELCTSAGFAVQYTKWTKLAVSSLADLQEKLGSLSDVLGTSCTGPFLSAGDLMIMETAARDIDSTMTSCMHMSTVVSDAGLQELMLVLHCDWMVVRDELMSSIRAPASVSFESSTSLLDLAVHDMMLLTEGLHAIENLVSDVDLSMFDKIHSTVSTFDICNVESVCLWHATSVIAHVLEKSLSSICAAGRSVLQSLCHLFAALSKCMSHVVFHGFCVDESEPSEEDSGGGQEGVGQGVGMGNGEGVENVSEQIEHPDQLMGLDNEPKDSSKQPEKNDGQGFDMDSAQDFEGNMEDLDEKDQPKEEELSDLEDVEGKDENDTTRDVDKKLWDEEDADKERQEDSQQEDRDADAQGGDDEVAAKEEKDDDDDAMRDDAKEKETNPQSKKPKPKKNEDTGDSESADQDEVEDQDQDQDQDLMDDHAKQDGVKDDPELRPDAEDFELPDIPDDTQEGESEGESDAPDGDEAVGDLGQSDREDLRSEISSLDEDASSNDDGEQDMTDSDASDGSGDGEEPNMDRDEFQKSSTAEQQQGNEALYGVSHEAGGESLHETEKSRRQEMESEPSGAKEESNGRDGSGQLSSENSKENSSGESGNRKKDVNPFASLSKAEKLWNKQVNLANELAKEDAIVDDADMKDVGRVEGEDGEDEMNAVGDATLEQQLKQEHSLKNPAEPEEEESEEKDRAARGDESELADEDVDMQDSEILESAEKNKKQSKLNRSGKSGLNENSAPDVAQMASHEWLQHVNQNPVTDSGSFSRGDTQKLPEELVNAVFEFKPSSTNLTDTFSSAEVISAWRNMEKSSLPVAMEIAEHIRTILTPQRATRLRGDYRSGKRISMKRIIPFVASQFRKDKIWLRRTKPAKRDYAIMLAMDNTRSMRECGAAIEAVTALSVLSRVCSMAEVGTFAVARLGDPSACGGQVILNPGWIDHSLSDDEALGILKTLSFAEEASSDARNLELCLSALDEQRVAANSAPGNRISVQLLLIVSDGRIVDSRRNEIVSMVARASERKQMVVYVIIDPEGKVGSMQKVSVSADGKVKRERYLDVFPYQYYVIVQDVKSLARVLGDALRQWMEALQEDM